MTELGPRATERLYETLARFQWLRRRLRLARAGEGLELRKRLSPPAGEGPADGAAGLDRWLRSLLPSVAGARVLDLGCGFGASLMRWIEPDGSGCGVTASTFQVARAEAEARRRGLADRCRFVVQDFAAPVAGPFDVVLAIESLGHARDLVAALQTVVRAMAPAGRFVWVEDLLRAPAPDDPDVATVAAAWSSPPLRDVASVARALRTAGLHIVREVDLTAQVPARSPVQLARSERRLRRWRACAPLPPLRRLLDAFRGGLALERLYARGIACYRVSMCERRPEVR